MSVVHAPQFVSLHTAGLFLLWVIASMLQGELQTDGVVDLVVMLIVGTVYALYLGGIAGIFAGLSWVGWKTVGPWLFVPILLTPLTLWLSVRGLSGFLEAQADDLGAALVAAGAAHDWMVASLGAAARIGPPILIIALPLLLADFGIIVLQPAVLWELLVLAADVALVLCLGLIPAAMVSAVVLPLAYVSRYRRRTGRS